MVLGPFVSGLIAPAYLAQKETFESHFGHGLSCHHPSQKHIQSSHPGAMEAPALLTMWDTSNPVTVMILFDSNPRFPGAHTPPHRAGDIAAGPGDQAHALRAFLSKLTFPTSYSSLHCHGARSPFRWFLFFFFFSLFSPSFLDEVWSVPLLRHQSPL